MVHFLILLAFVLQLVTAAPDSVSNITGPYNSTGSTPLGNATLDRMRADLELRVQNMRGCDVAEAWMPSTMAECTEWCDLKDSGWNNILRYHVRLTGTGVNPDDCRAPTDPDLGVYVINGWTKNVGYQDGINIRFDWWGWWEPRDAMHDCVASAIRMGRAET
ncbi:hypothetical protein DL771_002633 [Monosporascus sp. 5C6A]|nr:hypothetical protein DL771_002633 [Monosporascus sp. 5C6A]